MNNSGRLTATISALVMGLGLAVVGTVASNAQPPGGSFDLVADTGTTADPDDVAATAASKPPKEGDVRGHRRILIVLYHVASDCRVHANYPIPKGHDHVWTVKKGATIYWRYNVNHKVAAVSDPAAIAKGTFPHWGFVEDKGCIGKTVGQTGTYQVFHKGHWVTHKTPPIPAGQSVPHLILYGRSQFKGKNNPHPYWVKVDWHPQHGAVPAAQHKMQHNRTLRDAPHAFVIGNIYADWHVRTTGIVRDGYTKVYVPALHRWGWLQL